MIATGDREHPTAAAAFATGAVLLVAAGLVRYLAARNDLWLDEIWSLRISMEVATLAGILTEVHHDNNHYLTTLFMRLLGPDGDAVSYRIPSILAGIGTVAVAGLIGRARGRSDALLFMALTASSHLLIHYSSEARGYSQVMFFSLLSWHSLERSHGSRSRGWRLAFAVSSVAGFLSHLTFLFCYAGACVYSGWKILEVGGRRWQGLVVGLQCHGMPLAAAAGLYLVDVRAIEIGGGPDVAVSRMVVSALSLAAGGPEIGTGAAIVAGLAAAVAIAGLVRLWQDSPATFGAFITTIVLAPALAIALSSGPSSVYIRYLLVPIAFLQLAIWTGISRLLASGRWARWAAAALVVLILGGNALSTARLLRHGRGSYRAAVELIRRQTVKEVITITTNHDFRNGLVLQYYLERTFDVNRKPAMIVPARSAPGREAEWHVRNAGGVGERFADTFVDGQGRPYRLVREYPYGGLSGWRWGIYRAAIHPDQGG